MGHCKKKKSKKQKSWKRAKRYNRHHIYNKCRGGKATTDNLLWMDIARHNAWHFLFKNMSFTEVAELLLRVVKIKKYQLNHTIPL